jgi:hypothetical protein
MDWFNDQIIILSGSSPSIIVEDLVNIGANVNNYIITGMYHFEAVIVLHKSRGDKKVNLLSNQSC